MHLVKFAIFLEIILIQLGFGESNFEIKDKYAYFCQLTIISLSSLKLLYLLLNCYRKDFYSFYKRDKI